MNRKLVGIVAIAVAVVVSQSSLSEACHRHRKTRHARSMTVVQTPQVGYDYVATQAYASNSGCGCASSGYGSEHNGSSQSGYAPMDPSQIGAIPLNQPLGQNNQAPGYSSPSSSAIDARVNGNVLENRNVLTPDVKADIGIGR